MQVIYNPELVEPLLAAVDLLGKAAGATGLHTTCQVLVWTPVSVLSQTQPFQQTDVIRSCLQYAEACVSCSACKSCPAAVSCAALEV